MTTTKEELEVFRRRLESLSTQLQQNQREVRPGQTCWVLTAGTAADGLVLRSWTSKDRGQL